MKNFLASYYFYIKIFFAIVSISANVQATTVTTNMTVSATVVSACVVTATPLSFGAYEIDNIQGNNLNVQTSISLFCSNGTNYQIAIDFGQHSSGTQRRMLEVDGTENLQYQIYQDSIHTMVWGNTEGVDTLSGQANGTAQTIPVYGSVSADQNVSPGVYQDTLLLTVTF